MDTQTPGKGLGVLDVLGGGPGGQVPLVDRGSRAHTGSDCLDHTRGHGSHHRPGALSGRGTAKTGWGTRVATLRRRGDHECCQPPSHDGLAPDRGRALGNLVTDPWPVVAAAPAVVALTVTVLAGKWLLARPGPPCGDPVDILGAYPSGTQQRRSCALGPWPSWETATGETCR